MSNKFTLQPTQSLFIQRLERLLEFRRISIRLTFNICFFYFKKLFNVNTKANKDNYYFLTLINTNSFNISSQKDKYYFRTSSGQKILSRKLPSSDLEVFNQVWGRKEYSKASDIVKLNCSKQPEKINIIDAGANVGYTTIYFNSVFPGAKIIAVEPDNENFNLLKQNIEINALDNVFPLKAGLWGKSANLKIQRDYWDLREWAIRVEETSEDTGLKGISIESILLDYQIEEIDLLKIDIEGAEKYLFENEQIVTFFLSKTKVLAIEIHDEFASRENIYNFLTINNFNYFDYSDLTIAFRK